MTIFDSFRHSLTMGDCCLQIKSFFGDNPLFEAIKQGQNGLNCPLDVVHVLLDHNADVNFADESGVSCLHLALKYPNNEAVIRELLDKGADVNRQDKYGTTPLLVLLEREDCSAAVVRLLIRHGAAVNCMVEHGKSALAAAIQNSKDDSVLQILLEAGANIVDERSEINLFLLLLYQRKNCSGEMVKLFLAHGADVNIVNKEGYSPLAIAIKNGMKEEVIQALLEGGASVNIVLPSGESPLSLLLWSYDCSVAAVKLLLDYNSDVNWISDSENSLLDIAIIRSRGKEIIRALIDNGTSVELRDSMLRSALCYAFEYSSNDIIRLLLDAGCTPKTCMHHDSGVFCAIGSFNWEFDEDIFESLLDEEIDLNSDQYKRSVICVALQTQKNLQDLDWLIAKGASLKPCKEHESPLICATSSEVLKENVLKWLLDRGARIEDNGWEIMEKALGFCDYEVGAIQLLLDLPGMMDCIVKGKEGKDSILHIAVGNINCKPGAVELLLSRICEVNGIIKNEKTLLHSAVANYRCSKSLLTVLFQYGIPVNMENENGDTPLVVAARSGYFAGSYCEVIKELLIAGANIGEQKCCNGFSLLQYLLEEYDNDNRTFLWDFMKILENANLLMGFKILMKFFFLQNPQFDYEDCKRVSNIEKWYRPEFNEKEFKQYANDCLNELKELESIQIGNGFTLCEFARGFCLPWQHPHSSTDINALNLEIRQIWQNMSHDDSLDEPSSDHKTSAKKFNLDQLLKILAEKEFKVYFEVLVARVDRAVLEKYLSNLKVYASKPCSPTKKVYLNEDILSKISTFLSKENLLSFIRAFYIPNKSK